MAMRSVRFMDGIPPNGRGLAHSGISLPEMGTEGKPRNPRAAPTARLRRPNPVETPGGRGYFPGPIHVHLRRTEAIARRPHSAPPVRETGPRVNGRIRAPEIRLIGAEGENLGVVEPRRALELAEQAGLDLVEISPNATPPVCKIMDFGKFKYETQKREAEARKKQKVIEIKEIKMRPMIDDHDYDVKMRAIRRFFEEGDKVKITLRFRGREMAHQELGQQLLDRVKKDTVEIAKVESEPRFEGRQIVMVLAPR
jgi:translation initiation factor IF-3